MNCVTPTEQSTSDEKVLPSASAGPSFPTERIYTRFKLSFSIDNIQMELFTGDRAVVSVVTVISILLTSRL